MRGVVGSVITVLAEHAHDAERVDIVRKSCNRRVARAGRGALGGGADVGARSTARDGGRGTAGAAQGPAHATACRAIRLPMVARPRLRSKRRKERGALS